MSSATTATTTATIDGRSRSIRARDLSFFHDLTTIAGRALRAIPRDPEAVIPAIIVGAFFYAVNVGALQDLTEGAAGGAFDFKAFQLPVAIVFSVTGVSRAGALVADIQDGYFDRLLLTPVSRTSILLGLMLADFALVVLLSVPVVILGLVIGVSFATGILGMLALILFGGLWGLAFTGFSYAIALKTGNPAAVNSSFLLFFPFAFLTTSYAPKDQMTGWLATVSTYNPVTYILEAMRSLILGWDGAVLLKGAVAVAGVGLVSSTLALLALRGRVNPD
jgi:ABC-2 type transport system permease protein